MDDTIIAISNGMPLVSAEVQAYYDGWEHGRKALIKELKAEIKDLAEQYKEYRYANTYISLCMKIIDKHAGGE